LLGGTALFVADWVDVEGAVGSTLSIPTSFSSPMDDTEAVVALSSKMHNLRALAGSPDDADADDDAVRPCRRRQFHELVATNVNGTAAGNAEDEPDSTKAMAKTITMTRAATIYNTVYYFVWLRGTTAINYLMGVGVLGFGCRCRVPEWSPLTYTWHVLCSWRLDSTELPRGSDLDEEQ
jgi:hypothetical protein